MTAAIPTLEGKENSDRMPGTVLEFGVPADEFVLEETLARLDGVRFTIERVVATAKLCLAVSAIPAL
jgi:hypothetical protein